METLTLCTPWVDTWLPSLLLMDTLACVCKGRPSLSKDHGLLTLFAWAEQQSLDKSALWLAHVCEQSQRSSCLIRANSCADNIRSMRAHCGWLTSCEQSPRRRCLIKANSCAVMPVALATTGGTSTGHGLILARLDIVVATAAKAQARSANGMNQGSRH
jgi:hypothetical protein